MPSPSVSLHEMGLSLGAMHDAHPPQCNKHGRDDDSGPVQVLRESGPSHGHASAPHTQSPSLQLQAMTINEPTDVANAVIPANQGLVMDQPARIQDLSVEEAAPPPGFIADPQTRHRSNVFRRYLFGLKRGCIYNTPLAFFIIPFYWFPASIFIICVGWYIAF